MKAQKLILDSIRKFKTDALEISSTEGGLDVGSKEAAKKFYDSPKKEKIKKMVDELNMADEGGKKFADTVAKLVAELTDFDDIPFIHQFRVWFLDHWAGKPNLGRDSDFTVDSNDELVALADRIDDLEAAFKEGGDLA